MWLSWSVCGIVCTQRPVIVIGLLKKREQDNGSYTCIALTVPLSAVSVLNAFFW